MSGRPNRHQETSRENCQGIAKHSSSPPSAKSGHWRGPPAPPLFPETLVAEPFSGTEPFGPSARTDGFGVLVLYLGLFLCSPSSRGGYLLFPGGFEPRTGASVRPVVDRFVHRGGFHEALNETIDDWVRLFKKEYGPKDA